MDLAQIAINYTTVTKNLKSVKDRIALIVDENDARISLERFRKSFYDDYKEDSFCAPRWVGWESCLYDCGIKYTPDEFELALLLDQKSKLVSERAEVKRKLYYEGLKLINRKDNIAESGN